MNIRLLLLPLMAIALQACKTENAVKNSENYVERNINVNDFTDISIEGMQQRLLHTGEQNFRKSIRK